MFKILMDIQPFGTLERQCADIQLLEPLTTSVFHYTYNTDIFVWSRNSEFQPSQGTWLKAIPISHGLSNLDLTKAKKLRVISTDFIKIDHMKEHGSSSTMLLGRKIVNIKFSFCCRIEIFIRLTYGRDFSHSIGKLGTLHINWRLIQANMHAEMWWNISANCLMRIWNQRNMFATVLFLIK